MIPEGRHAATVAATALGKTSSGKSQLAIAFTLEDGSTISAYRYFSEKAIGYTEADLKTLGWDPIENGWNVEALHETDVLVGAVCSIVVEQEEYEGKVRAKVAFINEVGGVGLKDTMSGEEAQVFGAKLRKAMGVSKSPVAAKAAAVDDDLPF